MAVKQRLLNKKFYRLWVKIGCIFHGNAVAYTEHSQTFRTELFVKIVHSFQLLTIFAKNFILDICLSSDCTSETDQFQRYLGKCPEIFEIKSFWEILLTSKQ